MWDDIMNNSDEHWGSKNKEKKCKKRLFLKKFFIFFVVIHYLKFGVGNGFRI
jgi:hypothetical protein